MIPISPHSAQRLLHQSCSCVASPFPLLRPPSLSLTIHMHPHGAERRRVARVSDFTTTKWGGLVLKTFDPAAAGADSMMTSGTRYECWWCCFCPFLVLVALLLSVSFGIFVFLFGSRCLFLAEPNSFPGVGGVWSRRAAVRGYMQFALQRSCKKKGGIEASVCKRRGGIGGCVGSVAASCAMQGTACRLQ